MIVVANAGPLISLAQIGQIDLLRFLFRVVHIPAAVRSEVLDAGRGRAGSAEVQTASWIRVVSVREVTAVDLLRERLGAGESEAIVLAIELGADLLLIDEARGRRVADARGLAAVGTLGILLEAKRRRLIPALAPLLAALVSSGFHMTPELYRTVKAQDKGATEGSDD